MAVNKYIQSVVTGILGSKTVQHVEHNQPVTPRMRPEVRHMNYVRQNEGRSTFTVAQQRQIRRMQRRALYT